ncbi:anthranilate synthase component I family protein [Acetobacter fallax]|uniref:Anthranilate synthase component I family protein n=1 Tax=Acetobacter fallax TaxID=1737473 RepID=A0ABX0KDC9_9PROT|nr:anthranilate synthase component I family protein [Acetobacter fallax]NHO33464.1 anthranilate synthase component I family protein [Acetobacter fallax]NHO37056.1 anthranilate synthase component I family protein [Acetobacter fallax]
MRVGVRVVELGWVEPGAALSAFAGEPWIAFADSGGDAAGERARWSFLCPWPVETLLCRDGGVWRNGEVVSGDVREHLREMRARICGDDISGLPFSGGVIGLASYEAGMRLEGVVSRHRAAGDLTAPELVAASYEEALVFDRLERRVWWVSGRGRGAPDLRVVAGGFGAVPWLSFRADMGRDAWLEAVREVVRFIGAGDIFQANLTMRWQAEVPVGFDDMAAYLALREGSPAPFGAYLRTPGFSLLSASVERFVSMAADGGIETRPIKGTAPSGASEAEAAGFAAALAADEKENAENLMITDLMRNDIGRVCEIGSVSVPQLCGVERFRHLHHLVSCVRGRLRGGLDAVDLLRATLPPGSVTGAPKRRAMEIIDALEGSARGAYCGSVFRIGRDGALDSSVVIRSISLVGRRLLVGAGGGITWLSDPEREYEEMMLKVAPLLDVFSGGC